MTNKKQILSAGSICFGLNRDIDETSLKALCERFSRSELLSTLIPRLSDQELHGLADNLFAPMKKYFSKEEYHTLFLNDQQPGNN
jgi:hypothetical protein